MNNTSFLPDTTNNNNNNATYLPDPIDNNANDDKTGGGGGYLRNQNDIQAMMDERKQIPHSSSKPFHLLNNRLYEDF
jgi:hypothetical protein